MNKLFGNKLNHEFRVPVLTFSIPWIDDSLDLKLGLLIPSFEFWMQLTTVSYEWYIFYDS